MKIEKGIPIPQVKTTKGRPRTNFREKMEVGDSYVCKTKDYINETAAVRAWARRKGWKFTARRLEDGSVRVWRVK